MMIRILLADDHLLVRSGVRALLGSVPGLEVVAEASDGEEALKLGELHNPDIAVLDISMKGMNGLEAARRFRQQQPKMKMLMLSMYGSEEYVMQALNAGANGYLLKDSASSELERAIRQVMLGESYLDSHISRESVSQYMKRAAEDGTTIDQLTPRQRQILQMIAEGCNTKQIAYQLNISAKTVETHRAQLMERLNIRDVPGLTRYAIRVGLTTSD